jgi:uncharacterized protein YbjT (DUF2867 family)
MKIVVIGGTGLIGTKLVKNLRDRRHEVVAASPSTGVNTLTGEGLATALAGAEVAVDVANAPSFEDTAVMSFFRTSAQHLLPAEALAGVKHHVALSVIGAERLPDSGYMRAKIVQEDAIKANPVPWTIVRATQFFEFLGPIVDSSTVGDTVHITSALVQPIAAVDVSDALTEIALDRPARGTIEIAGPQKLGFDDLARRYLRARQDPRNVVTDAKAPYFGAVVDDRSLTPENGARVGKTDLEAWLRDLSQKAPRRG